MQIYLVWCKELYSWISYSDLLLQDISCGQFVINLLIEVMLLINSLSNLVVVKCFFEIGGKSLLDGFGYLVKDLVNNGGMLSQVDMDVFEVGKNLVIIEGVVVFCNDVLELIQYWLIIELVYECLLLVVLLQINKFYVFDLLLDKSLVCFCLCNGVQIFIVSWCNLIKLQCEWGLIIYIEVFKEVIEVVLLIIGSKDFNFFGVCFGGIIIVILVGYYVVSGEKKVNVFI